MKLRWDCEDDDFIEGCKEKFRTKRDRDKHRGIVHETYLCSWCKMMFENLEELKVHEKKHRQEQQTGYKCWVCMIFCETYNELRRHCKSHETVIEKTVDKKTKDRKRFIIAERIRKKPRVVM